MTFQTTDIFYFAATVFPTHSKYAYPRRQYRPNKNTISINELLHSQHYLNTECTAQRMSGHLASSKRCEPVEEKGYAPDSTRPWKEFSGLGLVEVWFGPILRTTW